MSRSGNAALMSRMSLGCGFSAFWIFQTLPSRVAA
jgi:hypothetical protein